MALNISLSEQFESLIEAQIVAGKFQTANDYIAHLILQDHERQTQQKQIEALLIEGLESGESIEVTDDWWEQKRKQLLDRHSSQ